VTCGPIHHPDEPTGNRYRDVLAISEPRSQRTRTPSLAVIAHAAGADLFTTDGRRLTDFTSGVLVTNLGHHPPSWMARFRSLLGWDGDRATPLNVYNAVTPVELQAAQLLLQTLRRDPRGHRLERIVWAASGSEAVHKALTAGLQTRPDRPEVIATRFGFHGKKGWAAAVSGSENDAERDPRVHFVRFPMAECRDLSLRNAPFDPTPYLEELERLWDRRRERLGMMITEPYLGGGGSYHPPMTYLECVARWCRERGVLFILDEVQANFGRTGALFAFQKYGVAPDLLILGKSVGNGVPVAAVAGPDEVLGPLPFGELSDTWSANPLASAAVVATLEAFSDPGVLDHARRISPLIEDGLVALKRFPFVRHVRGEWSGMVWGIEFGPAGGRPATEVAMEFVRLSYLGNGREGVHLLGPLAGTVVRIAPPLTIDPDRAAHAVELLSSSCESIIKDD
jgi:4-aminobutyrate aminotransferase-like enzyme